MTVTSSIKAMPTIADANGDKCVSQAAVLALIEAKAEEWRETADSMTVRGKDAWEIAMRDCAAELAGERLSAERVK